MNRKTPFFSAIAIALLLISVVVAQILLSKPLPNDGSIVGAADLRIIRGDTGEEITQIHWGGFNPSIGITTKLSSDPEVLGTYIVFENVGNVPLVVGWNVTDLPAFMDISATWGGASLNPYPQNDFNKFRIDPGYVNGYVAFTLTLNNLNTPAQAFAFTIWLHCAEAP